MSWRAPDSKVDRGAGLNDPTLQPPPIAQKGIARPIASTFLGIAGYRAIPPLLGVSNYVEEGEKGPWGGGGGYRRSMLPSPLWSATEGYSSYTAANRG